MQPKCWYHAAHAAPALPRGRRREDEDLLAGDSIVDHTAGIDDLETAMSTYWGAIRRWPNAKITLRQGARVVIRNWQE
jgi:hypothetical protein